MRALLRISLHQGRGHCQLWPLKTTTTLQQAMPSDFRTSSLVDQISRSLFLLLRNSLPRPPWTKNTNLSTKYQMEQTEINMIRKEHQ
jgi:hypothetical protein